jgi:pimeloyl-ACP methyl ester carboxylesterase
VSLSYLPDVRRFYLVGHDWGSALAWRIATTLQPRVIKLVAMSVGHHGAGFGVQGGARQRQASWCGLNIGRERETDRGGGGGRRARDGIDGNNDITLPSLFYDILLVMCPWPEAM